MSTSIRIIEPSKNNVVEWQKLEKKYLLQQTITIGIQDFSLQELKELLEHAKIKPMLYMASKEVTKEIVDYCIMQHIPLEITSSETKLNRLHQMEDILLLEQKYQNTTKQIVQRYFYQKQLSILKTIPTAILFTKEEIEVLDTLYYWI